MYLPANPRNGREWVRCAPGKIEGPPLVAWTVTIDFAAHLYPRGTMPGPLVGSPLQEQLGPLLDDPERLHEVYDEADISGAVLSQPFYMGTDAPAAAAGANDVLAEFVADREGLYGLASIPVGAGGTTAAAELERALDTGLNGGALETRSAGVELVDPALEPVLEVANDTRAPVLVHPTLDGSLHPDAFPGDLRLNAVFGREVALAESICKVIHHGVFDRYPDLVLVFHHLGGNIASMLGRLHLQYDRARWPGSRSGKSWEDFHEHLTGHVYVDTSGFFGYEAPLRSALEVFPPSQLLFGSDFPFEPRDAEELANLAATVENLAGTSADDVLARNAERVLVNV